MVSVIIPTFNRSQSLKRCIASLQKNDLRGVEVIVVYSGCIDNSEAIGMRNKIKFLKKVGSLSDIRNYGFRKARGEIIAYIDDDVEVGRAWVKALVNSFKDKSVGGVSGPVIISEEERKNRDVFSLNKGLFGMFYRRVILEGKEKEIGRIVKSGMWTPGADMQKVSKGSERTDVDYLEACNMAFRRSLVERVKGFDLNFKGTSEWCEVDLAVRVKRLGTRLIFDPKVFVHHRLSKEGVYSSRSNASERMENFLRFYFKDIRIDSFEKLFRFIAVWFFLNGYWVYKFMNSKNVSWLGGIWASLLGLRLVWHR